MPDGKIARMTDARLPTRVGRPNPTPALRRLLRRQRPSVERVLDAARIDGLGELADAAASYLDTPDGRCLPQGAAVIFAATQFAAVTYRTDTERELAFVDRFIDSWIAEHGYPFAAAAALWRWGIRVEYANPAQGRMTPWFSIADADTPGGPPDPLTERTRAHLAAAPDHEQSIVAAELSALADELDTAWARHAATYLSPETAESATPPPSAAVWPVFAAAHSAPARSDSPDGRPDLSETNSLPPDAEPVESESERSGGQPDPADVGGVRAVAEVIRIDRRWRSSIAPERVRRFEAAMTDGRRWRGRAHRRTVVEDAGVAELGRRLVWAVFAGSGEVTGSFRVELDGSVVDAADRPVELPEDALVGVAHPLHLGPALDSWRDSFVRNGLRQPFEQLERAVYRWTPDEADSDRLPRFAGRRVATRRVFALQQFGWEIAPDRVLRRFGPNRVVTLAVDPGIEGGYRYQPEEQHIRGVELRGGRFGDFDPVAASELLRQLEWLAA